LFFEPQIYGFTVIGQNGFLLTSADKKSGNDFLKNGKIEKIKSDLFLCLLYNFIERKTFYKTE